MAEKGISFRFELCCEETQTTTTSEIHFLSLPKTFDEVRCKIEDMFSVPVCVQTLYMCYQDYSHKIKEADTPRSLYVRNGDLFKVSFPMCGKCEEVICAKNILSGMVESISKILSLTKSKRECGIRMKFVTRYMLSTTTRADKLALCFSPFYPWTDVAHVNKLYLDSIGGVKLLLKFYELILEARKKNVYIHDRDMFEVICAHTVGSFTGLLDLSQRVAEWGGLGFFIDTFLWSPIMLAMKSDIKASAIRIALYAICNMIIPDHPLVLDQRGNLIMQAIGIGMTPTYKCKTAIVSIMLMASITFCSESSAAMVNPKIFSDVLGVVDFRKASHPNEPSALAVLETYASTVFSQVIINNIQSFQGFEYSLLQQVMSLMENVCIADPSIVRTYEVNADFFCGSSLPSLTSLYHPEIDHESTNSPSMKKLREVCTDTLLHTLHICLGRQDNLDVLVNENLLDYVVSLPWIVPEASRSRALVVVQEVSKFIQLQPLSLCSLAKAQLAKMKYGLRQVIMVVSISDLLHPQPPAKEL